MAGDVQARGGCSCAGPYGHRLLAIDPEQSHAFRDEIRHGCEGIKPGWVRLNFNYFISDTVADYLTDAVDLIATNGHRLLTGEEVISGRRDDIDGGATGLPPDFEALRWFHLPPICIHPDRDAPT